MKLSIIIALLSVKISASESQISDLVCTRDDADNKTCYFSNLDDPYKFYQDLENMSDSSKKEITKIYFKNCELTNIPKELTILPNFINVETLDASNVRLNRLQNYDFSPGVKIKYLNVSVNFLSSLVKKGRPDMMNRLINLDMSHNVIDKVDDDVFNYNSNLRFLNLSHNRIAKLGMEFFKSAKNLEILKLNNNRISHITWYSSGVETNLIELHLQNNELTTFYPSMIPSATFLDLSHNNLEEDLDFSYNKLIELKVSNNLLQFLKINKNLQTLDASSNEDKSFRIDFNGGKALKSLSLSNLDIPSYKKIFKDIQQLSNLTFLDMSRNGLNTFDFSDAKLPKTLEFLDLSRCEIHSLTSWESLKNLLPNLKSIDIRGNYLHCDDMKKIVNNFKRENLLIGFNPTQIDDYINKNCASDHHKHKEKEQKNQEGESSQNKLLWAILIVMMLGYVFGALFYANRRFNLVDQIVERISGSNGFTRHEFTNSP